jgi:DNA-binding transcriptional LysR family regulator
VAGVAVTHAAGKALAQHARLLPQHAERMQQDLAEYANGVKGQVRLLCNTTALTEYLPELLADFLREHPNLDIDLQELPSARITHALRQGAVDLGIVSDAVDTDNLQTLPFRDDPGVDRAPSSPSGRHPVDRLQRYAAPRLRWIERQQRVGDVPRRTSAARRRA